MVLSILLHIGVGLSGGRRINCSNVDEVVDLLLEFIDLLIEFVVLEAMFVLVCGEGLAKRSNPEKSIRWIRSSAI